MSLFLVQPWVEPPVFATFDRTDPNLIGFNTNLALANANLTAINGNGAAVRATVPIPDGLTYFEYYGHPVDNEDMLGIAGDTVFNASGNEVQAGFWGFGLHDGTRYINGATDTHGTALADNEVLGVFVFRSGSAVKVWFEDDGGYLSGDPDALTGPSLDLTLAFTIWPTLRRTNPQAKAGTINFGQSAWARTPPAGYAGLTV